MEQHKILLHHLCYENIRFGVGGCGLAGREGAARSREALLSHSTIKITASAKNEKGKKLQYCLHTAPTCSSAHPDFH